MASTLLAEARADAKNSIAAALPAAATDTHVRSLERAVYNYTVGVTRAQPKTSSLHHYTASAEKVVRSLTCQVGPFPDDVLGVMYLRGDQAARRLVEVAVSPGGPPPPTPREVMLRIFLRHLITHEGFARNRPRALEMARTIDMSCYNAAVQASRDSEQPLLRQWTSQPFVEIYSTRCGVISSHLNPDSSVCRAYGATLLPRLYAGDILPAALGYMKEPELCPQATANERAEIARRLVQKVEEKSSKLFKCPHCEKRNCKWTEVQKRSLDEAADYNCICLEKGCGHSFNGKS